ncbi:hypothetical protein HGRIS_007409 [Hohenbuehelia grisea]|uniref:Uncharacterized protein n=1 Tax=Hohenbuehelia grisea TaxID=104357 RepID=A0ABR3J525_9AGAR
MHEPSAVMLADHWRGGSVRRKCRSGASHVKNSEYSQRLGEYTTGPVDSAGLNVAPPQAHKDPNG